MTFTILPSQKHTPNFSTKFALKPDNWDDYGYKTTYSLYRRTSDDNEPEFIGYLSILFEGGASANQMAISKKFTRLDNTACSVSNSLDYYERLKSLPEKERSQLLTDLRDLVAHPELRKQFEHLEGYSKSLFRDMKDIPGFFKDAEAILYADYSMLPEVNIPFSFHPASWESPIEFEFDEPSSNVFDNWNYDYVGPSNNKVLIRRRVSVLIGRNGCGKSTLLSRLARVASASPKDRSSKTLTALGRLHPDGLGFTRIVSVSYSAFDSFQLPGSSADERRRIAKDLDKGEGRYIFCGLRDIAAEIRDDIDQDHDDPHDELNDRRSNTRLKPLAQLADEFERLIELIGQKGRKNLFESALDPLLSEPSFRDVPDASSKRLLGDNPKQSFLTWSTGHKIVLHVIASIIAHCERKSLVLFDEPESHLHPPLIAALMQSVRIVLEETNALCIVATHSPVVLQESLSRHVHIVERSGDIVTTRRPGMETFGESIGALTYDAFGLTAQATYFHKTLERLVNSSKSIEDIDALFPLGLSAQAEAYAMALFARKKS